MKKLILILFIFSVISNSYSSCSFDNALVRSALTPSYASATEITFKSGKSLLLNLLTSVDAEPIVLQDRQQVAFENMLTQLKDLHGRIYSLPYDPEYIRATIIPEVNANRASLAPHYPDRNTYGDNGEQAYQLLRIWFETYPSECQAYMDFLNAYIDNHSN